MLALALVLIIASEIVSVIPLAQSLYEPPEILWQTQLEGAAARSVVQVPDGGYIVLGAERSTQNAAASGFPVVSLDSVLFRIDSQGNLLWKKQRLLGETEVNFNLLTCTNSGIALAGTFPNDSTCLIMADFAGNVQWSKILNGTGEGYVRSFIQTSDSGFLLTGTDQSSNAAAGKPIWCIKTDEYGNETWTASLGTSGDSASAIVEGKEGDYAIIGTKTTPGSSQKAFEIIKIDSEGVLQWAKTYAAPVEGDVHWAATCNDGIITEDKGYLMVGAISNPSTQDSPTYTWAVKTDSLGNLSWNKTVSNTNSYVSSVAQAFDGGYAYCAVAGQDAWILKTDSFGNIIWNLTFPGLSITNPAKSIISTNDTGYALVGTTEEGIQLSKIAPDDSVDLSNAATILIEAAKGGTTDPAPGKYVCDSNTQVSILAKPEAGYKFEKWVSGNQEFKLNPLVFVAENGTYNLSAVFTQSNQSPLEANLSRISSFFSSPGGITVLTVAALCVILIVAFKFNIKRTKKNTETK
jgi:hypothetical protein